MCKLQIDKKTERQVVTYRQNNRAKLPSHTLGVSSFATAIGLASEHAIDNILAKPGATVHSAGVIGDAALSTLDLTPLTLPPLPSPLYPPPLPYPFTLPPCTLTPFTLPPFMFQAPCLT